MRQFTPRAGRCAFICPHKDHEGRKVALRIFAHPDAEPPTCHAHGKMVVQKNRPYLKQPIPTV